MGINSTNGNQLIMHCAAKFWAGGESKRTIGVSVSCGIASATLLRIGLSNFHFGGAERIRKVQSIHCVSISEQLDFWSTHTRKHVHTHAQTRAHTPMLIYTHTRTHNRDTTVCVICFKTCTPLSTSWYGVATISRPLKIISLFCKRALSKRLYSAKEIYNFKQPANRSHPIGSIRLSSGIISNPKQIQIFGRFRRSPVRHIGPRLPINVTIHTRTRTHTHTHTHIELKIVFIIARKEIM